MSVDGIRKKHAPVGTLYSVYGGMVDAHKSIGRLLRYRNRSRRPPKSEERGGKKGPGGGERGRSRGRGEGGTLTEQKEEKEKKQQPRREFRESELVPID